MLKRSGGTIWKGIFPALLVISMLFSLAWFGRAFGDIAPPGYGKRDMGPLPKGCPKDWHPGRFKDIGDGTILDTKTDLVWTKVAQKGNLGYDQAVEWAKSLGPGWRLPSIAELKELYDPCPQEGAEFGRKIWVYIAEPFDLFKGESWSGTRCGDDPQAYYWGSFLSEGGMTSDCQVQHLKDQGATYSIGTSALAVKKNQK